MILQKILIKVFIFILLVDFGNFVDFYYLLIFDLFVQYNILKKV